MDPELETNPEAPAPAETVADALSAEVPPDPNTDAAAAARHEANVLRLEHDIEVLEHEVKHVSQSLARRLGPPILGVVALSAAAYAAGRRMRKRASQRRGRKGKTVYRL